MLSARANLLVFAFTMCVVRVAVGDGPATFAHDVKPLLARRCFSCHGPNTHEAGLRLDRPETAVAALDSGQHAVVPGNIEQSELLARVSLTDETERMPPEGKALTPKEIETLKQW